jgi:parallel beta-helix repeat protein
MINGKKRPLKMILIILTIMLIFSFINSLIRSEIITAKNNTLYVGGSGQGNYTFIQSAVDNSSDNDTIFVYKGVYKESIFINKPINLIGFDKDFTIIQTNKSLYNILIKSPSVKISNFTIKNGKMGIYIPDSNYSYNNISRNIFLDNSEGIRLYKSSNNNIIKNSFINNNDYCIILYDSKNNKINKNYIKDNFRAFIFNRWSNNNIISKNNFTDNGACIILGHSFNNYINKNSLRYGIAGIQLISSNKNNISSNTIEFFENFGIQLTNSEENIFLSNNFSNNYIDIKEVENPPSVKAPGLQFIIIIVAIFIILCLKSKKSGFFYNNSS